MNSSNPTYMSTWLNLENIKLSEKSDLQNVHVVYNSCKNLKQT